MSKGLIPSYSQGLLSEGDGKLYFTDNLKYINIMITEISSWNHYTILRVKVNKKDLEPIWWKGKGYNEWSTTKTIVPKNIKVYSES